MTIRTPWLMVFLVGMAVLGVAVLALTTASGQSGGDRDNSVWVRVDGGPKQTGLRGGDVVGQLNRVAGECEKLNVTIGVGGATKSAMVGVDPDTCEVIVEEIVPNPKYDELMEMIEMIAREEETGGREEETANHGLGWQWFVEGHANFVGAADYETLTKTSSTFRVKTSSISYSGSLFDGSDRTFTCYGNHSGFPWYYYNEFCVDLGEDLTSTSHMWAKTWGGYSHSKIPSFGHNTWVKTHAYGNRGIGDAFDAICQGNSLPTILGAGKLLCEFDWDLIGWI